MSQSKHAMEVQDPSRMVQHLETLIGSAGYGARIQEELTSMAELSKQINHLEEDISRWIQNQEGVMAFEALHASTVHLHGTPSFHTSTCAIANTSWRLV